MNSMTVADVMTSPVLTVPDDWGLERLATFFIENNVSGAPVTAASGDVIGVVSMTDIVRHDSMPVQEGKDRDTHEYYLESSGREFTHEEMRGLHIESVADVTTCDLMTPILFQVGENSSVQDVADMMVRGGIHRVLVTRDGKLVGIVTALDLLKVLRDL